MDVIEVLEMDYARFPENQTYDIYARDVYFKDPMNEFRGLERYKRMIRFIQTWFRCVEMEVHSLEQEGDRIQVDWTLSWNTPLPWQPRIQIPGRSELELNAEQKIIRHVDFWDISRWDVVKQHFSQSASPRVSQ